MNCSEFKELVWAYALNALEPSEQAACDEHFASTANHQGCKEALEQACRVVPRMSAVLPPARPDPKLWKNIESQLAFRSGGAGQAKPIPRRSVPVIPWAIAAAAVILCGVAVGGGLALRRALSESNRQLEVARLSSQELRRCVADLEAMRNQAENQRAALALLELPSTQLVPLNPPQGSGALSRGSALLNQEQRKAMVLVTALQPQVGKDYELWIIRGQTKIAAGLLHPGADGRTMAQVDSKLLASGVPDAFAVTLEPEGGGESPRGPIVLVGAPVKG